VAVTGEAIGTAVPAAPVEVQRVVESLGTVRPADVMQGRLYFDFDIFHFFGIVIDVDEGGRIRGGEKRIVASEYLQNKKPDSKEDMSRANS
jgi:hypothetical protein